MQREADRDDVFALPDLWRAPELSEIRSRRGNLDQGKIIGSIRSKERGGSRCSIKLPDGDLGATRRDMGVRYKQTILADGESRTGGHAPGRERGFPVGGLLR